MGCAGSKATTTAPKSGAKPADAKAPKPGKFYFGFHFRFHHIINANV